MAATAAGGGRMSLRTVGTEMDPRLEPVLCARCGEETGKATGHQVRITEQHGTERWGSWEWVCQACYEWIESEREA